MANKASYRRNWQCLPPVSTRLKDWIRLRVWLVLFTLGVSLLFGCGRYPEPIRSILDIYLTSADRTMIVIVDLNLENWSKLQKFAKLEHFFIAKEMALKLTDAHLQILSHLNFPRLRDVSLSNCQGVTDKGINALVGLPSIESLQLIGTSITDTGMKVLATKMPCLKGVNISQCTSMSITGLLSIARSKTITSVVFSCESLSQGEVERLINEVPNVTRWTIYDPGHNLALQSLQELAVKKNIIIQIEDAKHFVTGVNASRAP